MPLGIANCIASPGPAMCFFIINGEQKVSMIDEEAVSRIIDAIMAQFPAVLPCGGVELQGPVIALDCDGSPAIDSIGQAADCLWIPAKPQSGQQGAWLFVPYHGVRIPGKPDVAILIGGGDFPQMLRTPS